LINIIFETVPINLRHIGSAILNFGYLTMYSQSATSETPIYQFS